MLDLWPVLLSYLLSFLVIAIFYAGVWLSLAMLLSIVFRSAATAALVALGIWLFLTVLWPMLAPAIAQVIAPPDPRYALLGLEAPDTGLWSQFLSRVSPNELFGEAMLAVLSPTTRTLGAMFLDQLRGAVRMSLEFAKQRAGKPDEWLPASDAINWRMASKTT